MRLQNRWAFKRRFVVWIGLVGLTLLIAGCSAGTTPPIIYVTATPPRLPTVAGNAPMIPPNLFAPTITSAVASRTPIRPTPNPTMPIRATAVAYAVQNGDTLPIIAASYAIEVDALLRLNPSLTATSILQVGQTINVPARPGITGPNFKIIPDSELVNSPSARGFDVNQYVRLQPGFLHVFSEVVAGRPMDGVDEINFLARANSINPRLLLALLEYRGGWLTNPVPTSDQIDYPLGHKGPCLGHGDCKGLFLQLSWAADWLNAGYYGWKYRGLTMLQFADNARLAFAPELNAGSVAVQIMLAQGQNQTAWRPQVAAGGLYATFTALFGDPFRFAVEPLIPANLTQPVLQFPFGQNELWYYTGGPHGGWDAASGWAAIDFAPPKPSDDLLAAQGACFVSPSFETAMAAGVVVRSDDGAVVINLSGIDDERVGWTLLYLHVADADRIAVGQKVLPGTRIGHASCQGFDLNAVATHLHIARRYNGEWLPADCKACNASQNVPPFVLGGWQVHGDDQGRIYQGTLERGGIVRRADQGRDQPDNQISW